MKTFAAILMLAASGCLAARIETITLDLERPQQPFTLTLTEATDSTVSAQLRASGSEFDPAGWTGLLWYGGSDGGQTLTNSTAGYGAMTWSMPVTSMPTNGRYSVQILGAISNRVEEWGRGALTVRINPSRDFLPAQWSTNNPAYTAALQALAGLAAHSSALNPHQTTAEQIGALSQLNWQSASNVLSNGIQSHATATNNPHGVTPAQIGALSYSVTNDWEVGDHKAWLTNENDTVALAFLATNQTTVVFNPTNSHEWTDGARRVWQSAVVTNTFIGWSVVIENPISICGEIIQPSTNQWPGIPYPLWANSALSDTQFITNYPAGSTQPMLIWYYYRTGSASPHEVHFSSPAEESSASWYSNYGSSSAGASPRGLLGQDDVSSTWSSWIRMIYGTNTTVSVVTSRVDTVAWQSDVTGKVDRVSGTASNLTVTGNLTLGGVSKSAWPSAYPTNYVAGFALPIPGTNMIYTLNVNSNGILEIWGVTP